MIAAQVQTADELPDQARAMTFVDQLFDVDAAQHKLLSIDAGKSRFSGHAVVAHIHSLPTLANFAMPLLGRSTISSQLPVPGFFRVSPTQDGPRCTIRFRPAFPTGDIDVEFVWPESIALTRHPKNWGMI